LTIPRLPAAAKHAARGGICLAGAGSSKNAARERRWRSALPSRGHYTKRCGGRICLAGAGFLKNAARERWYRSARLSRGHYRSVLRAQDFSKTRRASAGGAARDYRVGTTRGSASRAARDHRVGTTAHVRIPCRWQGERTSNTYLCPASVEWSCGVSVVVGFVGGSFVWLSFAAGLSASE